MKKSEMRKAFDKAIRKLNEADCAVQEFASYLVFKGYPLDREPQVSAVDETCIIITKEEGFGGIDEMSAEEAMVLMETKGCITPDDF